MTLILTLYLRLIRSWLSPLLYWLFRRTIYRGVLPDRWASARNYSVQKFTELLLSYPYKSDFLWGAIDFSPQEPNFFFKERRFNRDCDDWARMYFWWASGKGYHTQEVVICNGFRFWQSHVITIWWDNDGQLWLGDYTARKFDTIEGVKEHLTRRYYPKLVWVVNKTYRGS